MKIKLAFVFFLLTLWLWYIFPLKQYESQGLFSMAFKYGVALFYSMCGFFFLLLLLEKELWIELWGFLKTETLQIIEVLLIITGVVFFIADFL